MRFIPTGVIIAILLLEKKRTLNSMLIMSILSGVSATTAMTLSMTKMIFAGIWMMSTWSGTCVIFVPIMAVRHAFSPLARWSNIREAPLDIRTIVVPVNAHS